MKDVRFKPSAAANRPFLIRIRNKLVNLPVSGVLPSVSPCTHTSIMGSTHTVVRAEQAINQPPAV
jgi:hypothetical protein